MAIPPEDQRPLHFEVAKILTTTAEQHSFLALEDLTQMLQDDGCDMDSLLSSLFVLAIFLARTDAGHVHPVRNSFERAVRRYARHCRPADFEGDVVQLYWDLPF